MKFEFLSDLDGAPAGATIEFDDCESLGAVNLRGTGFATRDWASRELQAKVGGVLYVVQLRVAELSGFLLAKASAARERRAPKDWYDIAFVLLHNNPVSYTHLDVYKRQGVYRSREVRNVSWKALRRQFRSQGELGFLLVTPPFCGPPATAHDPL